MRSSADGMRHGSYLRRTYLLYSQRSEQGADPSTKKRGARHSRRRTHPPSFFVYAFAISHPPYAVSRRAFPSAAHTSPLLVGLVLAQLARSCVMKARLLDVALALEVLALDQIRYLVVIVIAALLAVLALAALLQALVALGQLPQAGERVGAELVEDAGDELRQLLVLAVAVDGEGVGGDGCVDCGVDLDQNCACFQEYVLTYPWARRSE